jgi:Rps23 Pro-64 3,4-dihydroxylase Tpa1-like proline 4-hydroxylase
MFPVFKSHGPQLYELLDTVGFAVIDGVLGSEWCTRIRNDIRSMVDRQQLERSQNLLTVEANEVSNVLDKKGIYEKSLVLEGKVVHRSDMDLCPNISEFFESQIPELSSALSEALPALEISGLDELKIQFNEGFSGCFPIHLDTPGGPCPRELTCVVYLNPDWVTSHGGELRVYPFPYEAVDIPPLFDRMVLFCSRQLLHRILPNSHPRFVLSLWFGGKNVLFPSRPIIASDAASMDADTRQMLVTLFHNPKNRMMLTKVIYEQEWAQSVRQAFGDNESVTNALRLHAKEAAFIRMSLSPGLMELLQTCLPLSAPYITHPLSFSHGVSTASLVQLPLKHSSTRTFSSTSSPSSVSSSSSLSPHSARAFEKQNSASVGGSTGSGSEPEEGSEDEGGGFTPLI